jgi:hypothetical protein
LSAARSAASFRCFVRAATRRWASTRRRPTKRHYRRVEFEEAELVQDVDAVVASTSLHHVADSADVLDRITTTAAETVDAGLYDMKHESRFVVTDTYDTGPECLEIVGWLARHTCAVLRRLDAP